MLSSTCRFVGGTWKLGIPTTLFPTRVYPPTSKILTPPLSYLLNKGSLVHIRNPVCVGIKLQPSSNFKLEDSWPGREREEREEYRPSLDPWLDLPLLGCTIP
jgi:hypothetical protein